MVVIRWNKTVFSLKKEYTGSETTYLSFTSGAVNESSAMSGVCKATPSRVVG